MGTAAAARSLPTPGVSPSPGTCLPHALAAADVPCARACPASGPTSSRDELDSIAFTLSTRDEAGFRCAGLLLVLADRACFVPSSCGHLG